MIGIENKDGSIDCSYCHCDGHPIVNGAILAGNYNSKEKVRSLLKHGAMSLLCTEIDPPEGYEHSFDDPCNGVCVFYHRDRGDTLRITKCYDATRFVITAKECDCEYVYLFSGGQWLFKPVDGDEFMSVNEYFMALAE